MQEKNDELQSQIEESSEIETLRAKLEEARRESIRMVYPDLQPKCFDRVLKDRWWRR